MKSWENRVKKISQKDWFLLLGKNTSPALFAMISSLIALNPAWQILFLTAMGIVTAWGQFGQIRLNELVLDINKHRNSFNRYFIPRETAGKSLLEKYKGNKTVEDFIAKMKYEAELYSKYKQHYGYVFYIGKKI